MFLGKVLRRGAIYKDERFSKEQLSEMLKNVSTENLELLNIQNNRETIFKKGIYWKIESIISNRKYQKNTKK